MPSGVEWSPEEDEKLQQLVVQFGDKKWSLIAQRMQTKGSKQCRRRWKNKLNTILKQGGWSPEEDSTLLEAHKLYGNKWTEIAKLIGGRTDNAVKNRWNALSKRRSRPPKTPTAKCPTQINEPEPSSNPSPVSAQTEEPPLKRPKLLNRVGGFTTPRTPKTPRPGAMSIMGGSSAPPKTSSRWTEVEGGRGPQSGPTPEISGRPHPSHSSKQHANLQIYIPDEAGADAAPQATIERVLHGVFKELLTPSEAHNSDRFKLGMPLDHMEEPPLSTSRREVLTALDALQSPPASDLRRLFSMTPSIAYANTFSAAASGSSSSVLMDAQGLTQHSLLFAALSAVSRGQPGTAAAAAAAALSAPQQASAPLALAALLNHATTPRDLASLAVGTASLPQVPLLTMQPHLSRMLGDMGEGNNLGLVSTPGSVFTPSVFETSEPRAPATPGTTASIVESVLSPTGYSELMSVLESINSDNVLRQVPSGPGGGV